MSGRYFRTELIGFTFPRFLPFLINPFRWILNWRSMISCVSLLSNRLCHLFQESCTHLDSLQACDLLQTSSASYVFGLPFSEKKKSLLTKSKSMKIYEVVLFVMSSIFYCWPKALHLFMEAELKMPVDSKQQVCEIRGQKNLLDDGSLSHVCAQEKG